MDDETPEPRQLTLAPALLRGLRVLAVADDTTVDDMVVFACQKEYGARIATVEAAAMELGAYGTDSKPAPHPFIRLVPTPGVAPRAPRANKEYEHLSDHEKSHTARCRSHIRAGDRRWRFRKVQGKSASGWHSIVVVYTDYKFKARCKNEHGSLRNTWIRYDDFEIPGVNKGNYKLERTT